MRAWKIFSLSGALVFAAIGRSQDNKDRYQRRLVLSFVDGQTLHERCRHYGEEYFPAGVSDEDRLKIENDVGYCTGYITAISESLDVKFWNPPIPGKSSQIIAVVKKYLENHPEKWNSSAFGLVNNSLIEAFPPRKGN